MSYVLIWFLLFLKLILVQFFHLFSVVLNSQIVDYRGSARIHEKKENMDKSVDQLGRENQHQGVQGPVDQIESHRNKISVFPSLSGLGREPGSQFVLFPDPSVDQGVQARGQDDATEEGDPDKHPEGVEILKPPVVTNQWNILVKVLRIVKEFVLSTRTNCFKTLNITRPSKKYPISLHELTFKHDVFFPVIGSLHGST